MRRLATYALAAALVAGCGGHRAAPPSAAPTPRLRAVHACAGGATCATLRVPLDRSGPLRGTLALPVAWAGPRRAPVLVALTGGPGQPGVRFLPLFRAWLGPAARRLRVVMLDQRGTGAGALRCAALQRAMGTSDLTVPSTAAIDACARALGPRRRVFTTTDTVADLDALRAALGAQRIALDGISYGTYVAERYALAHPSRVSRLVLDSVVPHRDLDPLYTAAMRAAGRVLGRRAAADLRRVVARGHDGPALLDTLVAFSIVAPRFPGVRAALRAAARGDSAALARLVAAVRRGQRAPPARFSQGLHAATLCGDLRGPWGGPETPVAGRAAALHRAALAARTRPFDAATAEGNGFARTCVRWPPAPPLPPLPADLPGVPALLLAGGHDLSTPLEWTRNEARHAPRGRLVVVAAAGHGVQRQGDNAGRRAMRAFLAAR